MSSNQVWRINRAHRVAVGLALACFAGLADMPRSAASAGKDAAHGASFAVPASVAEQDAVPAARPSRLGKAGRQDAVPAVGAPGEADTGEQRRPPAAGQPDRDTTATGARPGWSLAVIPAFFRTPDTGFGGGGGLILTHRPGEAEEIAPASRPNTMPILLLYTQRKQTIALVAPEFYFDNQNWRLATAIGYGNFPNTIYGIGNDTPEEAGEDYTIEYAFLTPTLARRIYASLSLGAAVDLKKVAVIEREAGGLFERMIAAGRERGWRSGAGPVIEWDSRDNLFAPLGGTWIRLGAMIYRGSLGSDFDYETRTIDLRHYVGLAPGHALALQGLAIRYSGEIPLVEYPSLGGSLRGVLDGRYNDRALLMGQAEYRYPVWKRFRGVLFAGLGDVNERLGLMVAREAKFAAGGGVRFQIDPQERLSVRMDIGFSKEGSQFYLQFSEAF